MPDSACHLHVAKSNFTLLQKGIDKLELTTYYPDWCITLQFYICVHLIEYVFATKGWHTKNHLMRDEYVLKFGRSLFDEKFPAHYHSLYDLSKQARYVTKDGITSDPVESDDELVEAREHFEYIVNYFQKKHAITL